ncbi:MAG: hypothetical protein NWQ09_13270 [Nonlabens sp.]|nr:hypothetical protein [Nonlabens sp.]MDP5102287.1 hypothetical protein [Nonlabens sp.]
MVEQSKHINDLMAHPENVTAADLGILRETINRYPYFQAARSLYLKGLKTESSPLYNKELQVTASHTADRSVLFDYITSAFFMQHKVSDHIKQQQDILSNIEVDSETVTAISNDLNEALNHQHDDNVFERKSEIIAEPLAFTKTERHSFGEWLKLTSLKPIERRTEEITPDLEDEERAKRMERIELFLQERPRIKPVKNQPHSGNLAEQNPAPNQLMTETLAQVYLAQKNYSKAIQAYEILVLQHPEKSGFFADRIREIKNLQSNT